MRPTNSNNSHLRPVQPDLPPSPPSSNGGLCQPSNDGEHETALQQHWDQSIAKYMDVPDGYLDVHVLMVKWEDSIDNLKVREEVDQLASVFRNTFLFGVTEVQLGPTRSQHQLDRDIAAWLFDHDGPNNLLIVYYAGHGVYDKATKALEICPDNIGTHPSVSWSRSEKPFIETVQADVFLIMDCCYASDMLRSVAEVGRTFEMLAASQIGQPTPQPGENSFTNSLIRILEELAVDSAQTHFTTYDLSQKMQKERDEQPALWRRLAGSERHIRLGRLKPVDKRPKTRDERPTYARFLHLGFALGNEAFDKMQIEALTKELPRLFQQARYLVELYLIKSRGDQYAVGPMTGRKRDADEAELAEEDTESHKRHGASLPQLLSENTV
ncbi:hypothetical protein T440DRAFT_490636 [Plenodomus tracheiphilus IPT5]|uniref:Uncharacterized protein n=1 Tax=Plenodomus tracheiphilus IPT5 TaxID=1408161 RepID=A0A6A7B3Z5_9PLEO|nr:hypothetical protein T440DRAFT_490636 [Plenodomus tracheiphilus IPT5]